MSNICYAIQGMRNNEWITLFSPIASSAAAKARLRELMQANPACRYRLRWFAASEPIIEQRSPPRQEFGGENS
jgi:hypothetical protein